MVTLRTRAGRRGASNLGCLFTLLIAAVVLYYGLEAGKVYWRYFEMVGKMKNAAGFANNESDAQILKQLQADAAEIGLPKAARQFKIVRTTDPRGIRISTQYNETIELPFTVKVVTLKPSIHRRL